MLQRIVTALLAALALAAPAGDALAQAGPAARTHAPDDPLPVDSAVTIGTLPNGLTYYIRRNARPENRAELRLVVNAGSILEDEDQLGLAHFVEHMAFNGTENFERQELVAYLESIGMRFGPDLNAYTSFDETVYLLTIPTDSAGFLETGLQILEDWAAHQVFDSLEVEKERGVVIEEWRRRLGAGARIADRQIPVIFHGSRYAERLPIGENEVLESFPHEALRRFYRDWYRPDLMAVVAVGDFDAAAVERLIRERFGRLPASPAPAERPVFPIPGHRETLVSIATDTEATSSSVTILYKQPARPLETVADYRRELVGSLHNRMLNLRLAEVAQRADPPFLGAGSFQGSLGRTGEAYRLGAGVEDGGILRGLEALLTEAERAARHGFQESELERARADVLRRMQRAYDEREKTNSGVYADEYASHFLEQDPIPGVAHEFALQRALLPGITLEEVNRLARSWMADTGRVVLVSAPEKEGTPVPTEAEVLAVFEAVEAREIPPYEDDVAAGPLVAEPPEPAPIVAVDSLPELGLVEWRLANGARVILKPTDFKDDEVLLRAFSPGGSSLAPDSAWVAAITADVVVANGGVGAFDRIALSKKLAGSTASVSPFVSTLEEGLTGSASPRDLETLFQLAYLYFTAPRSDSASFLSLKQRIQASLRNRGASPEAAFSDTLQLVLSQHHPRARPASAELFEAMDLDASLAFYRERFADAGDFTFLLVGSFDPEAVEPLVRTYIGGLPSLGREERWRDEGIRPPTGVVTRDVRKGIEPKSMTRIVFTGPLEYDRENAHLLASLADVLEIRLRDELREELGGTYNVSVYGSAQKAPYPGYSLGVSFGSAPERADELTRTVFREVERLREAGPTPDDVAKVREMQRRSWETGLEQNGYWISQLAYSLREGLDPRDVLRFDERFIRALTPERIREAARAWLDPANHVRVTLQPAEPGTVP